MARKCLNIVIKVIKVPVDLSLASLVLITTKVIIAYFTLKLNKKHSENAFNSTSVTFKLVKQQPSTAYTAAFGCLQVMLAVQQPLAAFKLCLLYSSL